MGFGSVQNLHPLVSGVDIVTVCQDVKVFPANE